MYKMPFSATKGIQLSVFEVKILHHILPTNVAFHKIELKEHDRCHLCAEKQINIQYSAVSVLGCIL